MTSGRRRPLRAKVMLRVIPLTLACCLALWALTAWRAYIDNIDSVTETLAQRLTARLELMEAQFEAVDDAIADVARSLIVERAFAGHDLESVASPYLRSLPLIGSGALYSALVGLDGEVIQLDRQGPLRRPALFAQALDLSLNGDPVRWIEGDALLFMHAVRIGGDVEGVVLVSMSLPRLFEAFERVTAQQTVLTPLAEAQAMLHARPNGRASVSPDERSRFVLGDGMIEGLMIAPLEREPGLALVLNKSIPVRPFYDDPVQQFLGAVFLIVLLTGALSVHLAASATTQPLGRLVEELRTKGLQIDQAPPRAAREIDDLRRWFRTAAEDVELSLLRERELNAKQRMFVSMVSHEFRTPLAIIDGSASSLQRRRARMSDETVAARLLTIRSSVARLVRLMEGALLSSSIESGTLRLALGQVDLRGVVATLIEERRAISPDAEFTVEVEALGDLVRVDERLIYSVIDNLLSNAVKYAHDAPRVRVLGWIEGRFACISVADNGVGIPATELPRIGERFFRASTSAGVSGTGIGMSMVAMVAKLHGGVLEVASTVGEGSTFTVRLPIAGPASHDDAGENASDPRALWRLVYRSRATVALDGAALTSLAAHAAAANGKVGVTGCLFQRNGSLAQALEGRRSELERIVALIRRDRRHTGFEIVATGPAKCRAYPDWAMLVAPPTEGADLAEALLADIARRTGSGDAPRTAAA
ncbi:ATP-binding protein [Rubrimonas cliftonensis]|nr:ATP-binding protein [Rubrimonas cliftonensis]